MIEKIANWLKRFPIISVEDGLSEDDWAHWPILRETIAGKRLTLGDDLLCTNSGPYPTRHREQGLRCAAFKSEPDRNINGSACGIQASSLRGLVHRAERSERRN